MSESVYKVIRLVGSSDTSWEEAAKNIPVSISPLPPLSSAYRPAGTRTNAKKIKNTVKSCCAVALIFMS